MHLPQTQMHYYEGLANLPLKILLMFLDSQHEAVIYVQMNAGPTHQARLTLENRISWLDSKHLPVDGSLTDQNFADVFLGYG